MRFLEIRITLYRRQRPQIVRNAEGATSRKKSNIHRNIQTHQGDFFPYLRRELADAGYEERTAQAELHQA